MKLDRRNTPLLAAGAIAVASVSAWMSFSAKPPKDHEPTTNFKDPSNDGLNALAMPRMSEAEFWKYVEELRATPEGRKELLEILEQAYQASKPIERASDDAAGYAIAESYRAARNRSDSKSPDSRPAKDSN